MPPNPGGPSLYVEECFQPVPFQMLSVPEQHAVLPFSGMPTQVGHGAGVVGMNPPENTASFPLTASSTTGQPPPNPVSTDLIAIAFQAVPFQVQVRGALIGYGRHVTGSPVVATPIAGQAMSGSANNPPASSSTARPETGSVARVPLPKPANGVVPDALLQSLPFHSQVARFEGS